MEINKIFNLQFSIFIEVSIINFPNQTLVLFDILFIENLLIFIVLVS